MHLPLACSSLPWSGYQPEGLVLTAFQPLCAPSHDCQFQEGGSAALCPQQVAQCLPGGDAP